MLVMKLKLVSSMMILAACAQAPSDHALSGDAAGGAAAQPAAAVEPAARPQSAAAAAKPAQPQTDAEAAQAVVPHGYHLVVRKGVQYYCSDRPALGTRVKSRKTCLTRDQFEQARADSQQKMREKQGQRQTWE